MIFHFYYLSQLKVKICMFAVNNLTIFLVFIELIDSDNNDTYDYMHLCVRHTDGCMMVSG